MASEEILRKTLKNADGKPFAKYKGLQNSFVLEDMELIFDDIQNDKTGHTLMRVRVPSKISAFPKDTYDTKEREIALRDLIARRFWESARTHARSPIPKTTGGEIYIPRPGQEILERGSIHITEYYVEACFTADLPSDNGKASAVAMDLLIERIRIIASESLSFRSYKESKLYNHIHTFENAEYIRSELGSMGLVSFIAYGSILPRRDDDLAPGTDAVPFDSNGKLKVTMDVPYGDPIEGIGIPKGFTVIAGPSGSGKSTLSDMIFSGIYNHIPGDGREYVITDPTASYIVSEPGRHSNGVDASFFFSKALEGELSSPLSEIASICEALEMGSALLLLDEQYSNPCVVRRGWMSEGETIEPISETAKAMRDSDISVILVSGDRSAIESADNVIVMKDFLVSDALSSPAKRGDDTFHLPSDRCPISKGMSFEKGRKEAYTNAPSIRSIEIGEYRVDAPVAALYDMSQSNAVADAVLKAKDLMDGSRTMKEVCEQSVSEINGNLTMRQASIRPMEVACILNRHPQLLAIRK